MARFTVTISDAELLAAIGAERDRQNAALPRGVMPLLSDTEFVQHIVEAAAKRFAKQNWRRPETDPPADLQSTLAARLEAELTAPSAPT